MSKKRHAVGTVCIAMTSEGSVALECRKGQRFELSGPMTRDQAIHIAIGIIDALATEDERELVREVVGW